MSARHRLRGNAESTRQVKTKTISNASDTAKCLAETQRDGRPGPQLCRTATSSTSQKALAIGTPHQHAGLAGEGEAERIGEFRLGTGLAVLGFALVLDFSRVLAGRSCHSGQ
jgi:hypothetical protein